MRFLQVSQILLIYLRKVVRYDVLITDQITEQEQHMVKEVRQLICVSDEDYEFL